MALQKASLTKKIALTQDVFELHYETDSILQMLPGQFITFILPKIGGRAYSVLELEWNIIKLIIKRWSEDMGWRWWSILLCDATVWENFNFVWPAGHFTLQENTKNKLFLWTGTGLVPLYNQIISGLWKNSGEKYQLVFGVRKKEDLFYIQQFKELKNHYPDTFYYHIFTSRSEAEWIIQQWYVTDFLSKNVVKQYGEYYICWAPAMIEGCQERLTKLWVDENDVLFEKY